MLDNLQNARTGNGMRAEYVRIPCGSSSEASRPGSRAHGWPNGCKDVNREAPPGDRMRPFIMKACLSTVMFDARQRAVRRAS